MIAVGAITIDLALRRVLIDQAKSQLVDTADQIEQTAREEASYGFIDEGPVTLNLSDRVALDRWASSSQFVQIDTPQGQVLGKSSNLGSITFPPFTPSQDRTFEDLALGGNRPGTMLVLNRIITDADGRPLVLALVGQRLDTVDQLTSRTRTILFATAWDAMIIVALVAYFVAAAAIVPIERLTLEIAEIGSEHLDRRLRWRRRDEVGRLAAAFDAMLDRLQAAFARERQFISDASHELRTPLTVINANAQMLQRWGGADPEVLHTSLEAIAEESGRLAAMVSGMLTLAKAESGDAIPKEPIVLERLAEDVAVHARDRAAAKGLTVDVTSPPGARTIVVGDPGLLRQLIGNLVDNAIKFTAVGGVEVVVEQAGGRALIEVRDTGPGIDQSIADRLFDRFFRGDPARARSVEGTGLGLAIVRSIARVHGGTVSAAGRPEGGSVFLVSLPAEPESLTSGS